MTEASQWWFEQEWNSSRRGTRVATLSWSGGTAEAVLYDEGAPRTVEAIVRMMPLTMPFVHVAWSGEMVMGTEPLACSADVFENHTRLVRPGDLTWDPKFRELCIVYGDAECRLPSGPNTVVVFGHVTSELTGLARFCRNRRFDGVGDLCFDLMEVGQ